MSSQLLFFLIIFAMIAATVVMVITGHPAFAVMFMLMVNISGPGTGVGKK